MNDVRTLAKAPIELSQARLVLAQCHGDVARLRLGYAAAPMAGCRGLERGAEPGGGDGRLWAAACRQLRDKRGDTLLVTPAGPHQAPCEAECTASVWRSRLGGSWQRAEQACGLLRIRSRNTRRIFAGASIITQQSIRLASEQRRPHSERGASSATGLQRGSPPPQQPLTLARQG